MGAAPHLITTGLSRSASPIRRSSSTWARSAIPIHRGYSIVIGFEVDPQGTLAERHLDDFRDRGRDRRVEPLELARKAFSDAGGSAISVPADVRDFDAIGRAVQKAISQAEVSPSAQEGIPRPTWRLATSNGR